MSGADVGRSKHVPFRIEPEIGQVTEDGLEAARTDQAPDVLEEHEVDAARLDLVRDVRPQPPRVTRAEPLAS